MEEQPEIWNEESVRAWLAKQPPEAAGWIAYRAAMRVAPVAWHFPLRGKDGHDTMTLPIVRCCVTLQVAQGLKDGQLSSALRSAIRYGQSAADLFNENARDYDNFIAAWAATALLSASEATFAANARAIHASWQSTSRAASHEDASDVIWQNVNADAQSWVGSDSAPKRLWSEYNILGRQWKNVRDKWFADDLHFWIGWYEDVLAGREPNWEVLREIALIPDQIWKQGPEAVAERIRDIEKGDAPAEGREPLSLNRALELNRTAILLQLQALREFVSKEVDRLRGPNSLSRLEHEQRQKRIEKLKKIIEAVALMHEAMDAEPTGSTALTVIGKQLPAVIEAADESIKLGGEPQVSEVIATMSMTIKHLTDSGTPGTIATAFAFADYCWRKIKSWRAG